MEIETAPVTPPSTPPPPSAAARRGHPVFWLFGVILVVALVAVSLLRVRAAREVRETTAALAVPSVHLVAPAVADATLELVLPGSVEPFTDTPIFSRTSGYVKEWRADIGAIVNAGDLLAEIDSPELDQQLAQAQAAEAEADATLRLARITADRWKEMVQRDTVSKQDSDEKQGQLAADQASLAAAQAEVRRLQRLKSFEKIVAPFSGRVAERKVNVGDLVSSGDITSGSELFRLVQDDRLRVFAHVPEVNVASLRVGQPARIELASAPGKFVDGKVANLAGAIDSASRTLLAEIQVPNADHRLLSGGYAQVHLPLPNANRTLSVPANTLLFRPGGTVVGVVGDDGVTHLRPVEIGRDFGTTVEITKGLAATDRIILNPSDSLAEGDRVQVAPEKITAAP